jgi:leader peptidase (prepilin peptidase)/N-methyltransferase
VLPDQEIPYEEIFYRKSDAIVIEARRLELVDRSYGSAKIRLSPDVLKIGDEQIDPQTMPHMEVTCSELVLPREAMGLGDVKFMAGIGAFLGWQGAVFSLMASSFIGSLVGIVLIVMRKREWSSRMPYGPYIALAAIIWMFGGKKLMALLLPWMS